MKNEEEIERLIREKDFSMLTKTEKEVVLKEFGSEEEYEAVRKIELSLQQDFVKSTLEPRAEILHALKQRLETPALNWVSVFQFRIPAYAAAIAIIVSSLVVYAFRNETGNETVVPKRNDVATITRVDTVYITKVDTVVRDRIIYRTLNVASVPKLPDAAALVPVKQPVGSGVSMKEKEELNKLLVSGSD